MAEVGGVGGEGIRGCDAKGGGGRMRNNGRSVAIKRKVEKEREQCKRA